jgi:hypothetical protein
MKGNCSSQIDRSFEHNVWRTSFDVRNANVEVIIARKQDETKFYERVLDDMRNY